MSELFTSVALRLVWVPLILLVATPLVLLAACFGAGRITPTPCDSMSVWPIL